MDLVVRELVSKNRDTAYCHSDECEYTNYKHVCTQSLCNSSCKCSSTSSMRNYSKYRERFSVDLEVIFKDSPFDSPLYYVAMELAKPQHVREWEELSRVFAGVEGLHKKTETGTGIRQNIMSYLRPNCWSFAREIAVAIWGLGRVENDEEWCSCVHFTDDSYEPCIAEDCVYGEYCKGLGVESWVDQFDKTITINWSNIFSKMIRTNWWLRNSGYEMTCVECGDYVESLTASRCNQCFYEFMDDDDRYDDYSD